MSRQGGLALLEEPVAKALLQSTQPAHLAYVARDCDERERCTDRLVVRDIGDAGSLTVLKGGTITSPRWAADGRFLIAGVTERDQHSDAE